MNKNYAVNDSDFEKYEGKRIIEGIVDLVFFNHDSYYDSINNSYGRKYCVFSLKGDQTLNHYKKIMFGYVSVGDYVGFVLKSSFFGGRNYDSVAYLKKYDKKTGEVLAVYGED